MKKITICSLLGLLVTGTAFGTCGQHTIGFDGTQKYNDDEFLYINKSEYDLTVSGWGNSNKQNSGSGHGFECDSTKSAGCRKGEDVTLPAGHVFKGKVVNQRVKYICRSGYGLNDHWEAQKENVTGCDTKFGVIPEGQQIDNKTLVDCSGLKLTEENTGLVDKWAVICRPGRIVVCKPSKCIKGYKVDLASGKCVKEETVSGQCNFDGKKVNLGYCESGADCQRATLADTKTGKACKRCCGKNSKGQLENKYLITQCPSGKTGVAFTASEKTFTPTSIYDNSYRVCNAKVGPTNQSCKEKFAGYPERIKCCEAGNATEWQPKDDWVNGQCICVDARKEWKNGKCVDRNISCEKLYTFPEGVACCKIGKVYFSPGHTCLCGEGLKWIYDANTQTGQCVADNGGGNDVVPTPVVPGGDCVYYFNGSVKCANGNTYSETTSYPIDANGDCEAAKRLFAQDEANLMKIKEKICQGHGSYIVIVNESEVKAAESTLLSFFGTAKSGANVWKDTEGNFNTARLASDLTAGVVLGTVGGVVSGVVIKKKQVEKGFDALHCTVGGQTVADWGDTFNVGLR